MRTQTEPNRASKPHFRPFHVRRIPRGRTGIQDNIIELQRLAEKHARRVLGMKQRVKNRKARNELKKAHQRLIEIIQTIATKPYEITVGTHDVIMSTVSEAREVYEQAPRRRKVSARTAEPKRTNTTPTTPNGGGSRDREDAIERKLYPFKYGD